jgi:hypothetical protein
MWSSSNFLNYMSIRAMLPSWILLMTHAISHDSLKSRRTRSLGSARPSLHAIASTVSGFMRPSITMAEPPWNFPTTSLACNHSCYDDSWIIGQSSVDVDLLIKPIGGGIHRTGLPCSSGRALPWGFMSSRFATKLETNWCVESGLW